MQPIRPVALVQRAKDECELAVEQRALDPVNIASGDGAETSVARHRVLAQGHGEVVQVWRVGRPDLDVVDGECELLVCGPCVRGDFLVSIEDFDVYGGVFAGLAVDRYGDWDC